MLFRALAFVLLLPPPTQASAQQTCPEPKLVFDYDDPVVSANDRRLWTETHRILRLPDEKRAGEIAHVYRDILSVLHPRWYPLANWHIGPIRGLDDYSKLLPGTSGPAISMYAQEISLALLAAYPQQSQPLIQRDLRSSGLEAIERGLFVAGHMTEARFPDLYDDLKNVYLSGRECSEGALRALFSYAGFPMASYADARRGRIHELTPVLVTRFQEDPARYASFLANLLSVGAVPVEVLSALESDDSTLRQHASHAVIASPDPRLASYLGRMLTDANPYVRLNALSIGFTGVRRRDPAYKDIKPALETLMRDPTWFVRERALETFVFTGDPVCVPVLVDLLKGWAEGDSTIPDDDFGQVAIFAEAISRRKFGFGDGTLPPRRDPANKRAIDRFSNWATARKP